MLATMADGIFIQLVFLCSEKHMFQIKPEIWDNTYKLLRHKILPFVFSVRFFHLQTCLNLRFCFVVSIIPIFQDCSEFFIRYFCDLESSVNSANYQV